jgi:hypothetical protein
MDYLVLTTENYLNPVEFLLGGKAQNPMEHCSLDLIKYKTKIQPDLRETPFLDGLCLWMVSLGLFRETDTIDIWW